MCYQEAKSKDWNTITNPFRIGLRNIKKIFSKLGKNGFMKKDLNYRYLKNRIFSYGPIYSEIKKLRTGDLATREIDTLENLLRLSGHTQFGTLNSKSILDLGAGDEFIGPCIKSRGGKYSPIDYDTADFNFDALPFTDNEFDLILSLAVIEHISNVSNYMSEIIRVLKPGGILYLTTPNFRYCYKSFFDDPTHVRPYTDKSIERLLRIWGFSNLTTFPGVRCKGDWFYKGKWRFFKCAHIPFNKRRKFIPDFLTGRATSVIAIAKKPDKEILN